MNKKLDKTLKDLNEVVDNIKKQKVNLEQNTNKSLEEIKDVFRTLKRRFNEVVSFSKWQKEYNEALVFFTYFKWGKIVNDKLAKEAKTKPFASLCYEQETCTPFLTKLEQKDIDFYSVDNAKGLHTYNTICLQGNSPTQLSDLCCSIGTVASEVADSFNKVFSVDNDGYVKVATNPNVESREIKWEETVQAVVAEPYKYDKVVLYNVYKYLVETIKKDDLIDEYTN